MTDDPKQPDVSDTAFLAAATAATRKANSGKGNNRPGNPTMWSSTAHARSPNARSILNPAAQTLPARDPVAAVDSASLCVDIDSELYRERIRELEVLTGRPVPAPDRMLVAAQCLLQERMGVANFHPVVELLVIGGDDRLHPDIRVRALGRAAAFVAPTLKSVEIVGNPDKPLNFDTTSAKQELAEILGITLEGEIVNDDEGDDNADDNA